MGCRAHFGVRLFRRFFLFPFCRSPPNSPHGRIGQGESAGFRSGQKADGLPCGNNSWAKAHARRHRNKSGGKALHSDTETFSTAALFRRFNLEKPKRRKSAAVQRSLFRRFGLEKPKQRKSRRSPRVVTTISASVRRVPCLAGIRGACPRGACQGAKSKPLSRVEPAARPSKVPARQGW